MSKSDDAQKAAREVIEQAYLTGRPAAELIEEIAPEFDIHMHVVCAWIKREYESLEILDHATENHHRDMADKKAKVIYRIRERELKYRELIEIIDTIPQNKIMVGYLKIPSNKYSNSWRNWIKQNLNANEMIDAQAFALARIRARFNYGKQENS